VGIRGTIERAGTNAAWAFAWVWVVAVAMVVGSIAGAVWTRADALTGAAQWSPASFVWAGLGAVALLSPFPVVVHLLSRVLAGLADLRQARGLAGPSSGRQMSVESEG